MPAPAARATVVKPRRRRASDPPRRLPLRRFFGALVVAALLAGGWGAVSVVRGSADLERAGRQVAAYQQARAAVRAEVAAVGQYGGTWSRAAAISFVHAGLEANEALEAAVRLAWDVEDQAFAEALQRAHGAYAAGGRPIASPGEAKRAHEAARLLDMRLGAAVDRARSRTLEVAAVARRKERVALAGLPVSVLLALGLLLLPGGRRRQVERHELRQMRHAALTDSLTGLGNHRAFHEDMKRAIRHRNATGARFSLIAIDLDGLKQINDTLGHQVGDERIKEARDLLRAVTRATDAAYRIGGDEFMIILPGQRAWGALIVAQRLQELTGRPQSRVSLTIGIAESIGLETADTLIRRADLALYEAKRSRRKVVAYSPELAPEPARRGAATPPDGRTLVANALARGVDAKGPTPGAHCESVSELCALIAGELGLDAATIARIRLAGLLHDVGTIGIPDAIIQKPSPLDPGERGVIETHPLIGESIVAALGFVEEASWIRYHHERYDGRGYPQGLSGGEIPLESRIILVADAFQALTAGRPDRKALAAEDAVSELERDPGSQFDPDCVAALRRALGSGGTAVDRLVA